jgi:hypothetical protein
MKDGTTEEYFQRKGVPRGTPFNGVLFYIGMFHVKHMYFEQLSGCLSPESEELSRNRLSREIQSQVLILHFPH